VHPNPAFRLSRSLEEDRALYEALIHHVGFGMIFATTPDGPRVAHVPLVSTGDGALHFHLARCNALTRHIDGMTALAVVNGPEGYVSPRWYEDQAQVPTWNYVALEMEGRVRRMDDEALAGLMETLTARQEKKVVGGNPWTMDKMPPDVLRKMLSGIVGFEMEIQVWRPTLKLSQNKPGSERNRVADGLESQGSRGIAELMRTLGGGA
jgi:transcriptional regulator